MQDVLVMMQEPVVPMCFMRVRPIGVMHMIDGGESDDKIIAVHLDDPEYKHIQDITEVPKHRLAEIRCACLSLMLLAELCGAGVLWYHALPVAPFESAAVLHL